MRASKISKGSSYAIKDINKSVNGKNIYSMKAIDIDISQNDNLLDEEDNH